MKSKIGIACVILLLITANGWAQFEVLPNARRGYVLTGATYQMYRIGGYQNPISQFAVPLSMLIPFGPQFNLSISHTPAMSSWYDDTKINGLSDTWCQGTYVFYGEKAMFNVGLGIPTGKTRLNEEEFLLSNWLSLNALRFQLPVYGQGLCAKAGFAMALPVRENIVIGFGGQYVHKRPYQPFNNEYSTFWSSVDSTIVNRKDDDFAPGDEVSGHAGFDIQIREDMKIMVDAIYTYYMKDYLADQEIYSSGQKVTVNLGYFYRMDKNYLFTRLAYRYKGKNGVASERGLPIEQEDLNSNGSQIELDVAAKVIDFDGSGIIVYGESRIYSKSESSETGKALMYGGGFGAMIKLNDTTFLDFRFKYLGGNVFLTEERSVEGMDTFLGLRFQL